MLEKETSSKRKLHILAELFLTFAKIGLFTFGGGYAMISIIDRICVEQNKWLSSEELMDITAIAESTPGPIAINCSTYTGYKMGGFWGAVAATLGVVTPSFIIIFLISQFFESFLEINIIANAFKGIRVAVGLLIIKAGIKLIRKMLKSSEAKLIQICFVAVFFAFVLAMNFIGVHISTVYLIIVSGLAGALIFPLAKQKNKGKDEIK